MNLALYVSAKSPGFERDFVWTSQRNVQIQITGCSFHSRSAPTR